MKILSHLGHFNIIRYKQAFIEDQSLNIIMEYADGGNINNFQAIGMFSTTALLRTSVLPEFFFFYSIFYYNICWIDRPLTITLVHYWCSLLWFFAVMQFQKVYISYKLITTNIQASNMTKKSQRNC